MISRNEYLYTKLKASKMRDSLFDFENKGETYPLWIKYQALPHLVKQTLDLEWDNYYQRAHLSYYGLMFNLARTAFKQNDIILLKSLIEQARTSEYTPLPKPSSIDPTELKTKMNRYFEYRHDAEQLDKIIEEYAPIYESKKKDDFTL